VQFLSRYGYLAEVELDVPPTMEQLKVAVQKFQRVVNLPITGQIDANTTNEMAANRCGVPDTNIAKLPGAPVSYNLFPNKWDKHHITWRYIKNYILIYDCILYKSYVLNYHN